MRLFIPPILAAASFLTQSHAAPSKYAVAETWVIDRVPSHFPVPFCLLTEGNRQYVAYYNADHQMIVRSRTLDSPDWTIQRLDSHIGCDSHNYITMAISSDGHLHVSGNMHASPLVYFRTAKPGEIQSLTRQPMTGVLETRVTYPRFFEDKDGRLIFQYRHGGSGNGNQIYNRYNAATGTWARLLDTPVLDGEGQANAYVHGPVRTPDGWFHLLWIWRDTPDCATNHHLSYARSRDLITWESAFGSPAHLPITLSNQTLWIDPAPSRGGMINGGQRLAFDAGNHPVVAYHQNDANGHMQIYAARPGRDQWIRNVLTDWDQPVPFSGGGSMGFVGIRLGELKPAGPDLLTVDYRHKDYGSGRIFFDPVSLGPRPSGPAPQPALPDELSRSEGAFPGLEIQRAYDLSGDHEAPVRYLLQWETLPPNNDRPRQPPLPEPAPLRLIKLAKRRA